MRYAVLGKGKRIRPLIAVAVGRSLGLETRAVLPSAACIELLHASSLVLDDLPSMDDAPLRRGRPTCHVAFDEATAILASMGLLMLCFETLARGLSDQGHDGSAVVRDFAQATGTTAGLISGQARDLWPVDTSDPAELARTNAEKTGSLFGLACALPARLAGYSEAEVARFRAAGIRLGVGFQVADDIRDRTGDVVALGKLPGSDARCGRKTLPEVCGDDVARRHTQTLLRESASELAALANDSRLSWLQSLGVR
jgi:geranylgeranyl pyrophosphate synthase